MISILSVNPRALASALASATASTNPQGARRVVCAFGWKGLALSSPEPQNESARLLGALVGQSRSKATAAPPSSDDGTSASTARDAIYRACQVRPQCPLAPRYCCKSLFASLNTNFPGRTRGDRIII